MKFIFNYKKFESLEFNLDDDDFYIYVESSNEKSILKLTRDYDWVIELEDGNWPFGLEESFRSQYDIDDILDILKNSYNKVELIDYSEIDNYI